MRRFFRALGIVVGSLALLIIGGIVYFNETFPKAEPVPNIKVGVTPERIARGKYLANHVTMCVDCHSERDWTKYAGPVVPGSAGKGGEAFDEQTVGVPGVVYAKNITPAGIGGWTDGELIRAITTGISKDGTALFPLMPYLDFNNLTREDLYSIVAYIRTLKSIENNVPERKLDFPMNMIVKTIPLHSYTPASDPSLSDTVAYGKYVTTIAGCADCHTMKDKGQPVPGMEFAGGMPFNLPWGTVRSANITPDKETGIGSWTKEQFISFFKSFASDSSHSIPVNGKEFNTIMPVTDYAGMTEQDLGAIYAYLRTLTPVHNRVNKYTPKS